MLLGLHRLQNHLGVAGASEYAILPGVPGRQYRLVFTGRGDRLVGQVFDLASPSAPLATLAKYDGTYAQGTVGVFAMSVFGFLRQSNDPVDVTFDNFAVATPEPWHEFTEDFDDGNDTHPGFHRYDLFGSLGAPPAEFTFADGAMSIAAPASVAPGTIGAYAGATLNTPLPTDVETSVDFWGWNTSPDARSVLYLTARGRDLGDGTFDYYGLFFNPTPFPEAAGGLVTEPAMSINKISANVLELPGLALTRLTNLTLNASTRYRLRFSVQGDSLRGWLFDLSNLATPPGRAFRP